MVGGRALNQRGDGDGGADTPGSPIRLLRTHHLIPQPAEYVSVVTENAATVERFDPTGALVETITTAKTSGEPLAPFAHRFGTTNNTSNFDAATLFVCSEPMHCVYQPEDVGAFGSDTDETISLGYNLTEF